MLPHVTQLRLQTQLAVSGRGAVRPISRALWAHYVGPSRLLEPAGGNIYVNGWIQTKSRLSVGSAQAAICGARRKDRSLQTTA